MMLKRAPIGVENFAKLVDPSYHYLFADRTLAIKLLVTDADIIAFHTFRRGGKSLFASMLHYFFAADVDDVSTKGLFDNLQIGKDKLFIDQYQGQYPVITLSFKEVQEQSFESAQNKIQEIMMDVYGSHRYLLESFKLDEVDKINFRKIWMNTDISKEKLEHSLLTLTRLLYKHHGKKVWVIIDEYDTPLTAAYRKNYLDSMTLFMKNFLSAGLKTNNYLEKAVLTGILRISKESILSGLNNLEVYTLLNPGRYSPYFGFTEQEVLVLFQEARLLHDMAIIRQWYNGYQINGQRLYNPWSIMKYIHQGGGEPGAFWVNTANDSLLQDTLLNASDEIKLQFAALMADAKGVEGELSEIIRYETLQTDSRSLWSLLVAAGYLTVEELHIKGLGYAGQLRIPNEEVRWVYVDIFSKWLEHSMGGHLVYQQLLSALIAGEVKIFTEHLNTFLLSYCSHHDLLQENSYHMLVLGLLAGLTYDYYLHSNTEAGLGRLDILLIPRNPTKPTALILEFKYTQNAAQQETKAQDALAQIDARLYQAVLAKHPTITEVLTLGLAFCHKSVVTRSRLLAVQ